MVTMIPPSEAVVPVRRATCQFEPKWQKFQTSLLAPSSHQVAAATQATNDDEKTKEVHPYQRQYSHIYHQRQEQLAPLCRKAFDDCQKQGARIRQVDRLLELEDEIPSFVVGTLVKESSSDNDKKKKGESELVEGTHCRASDVLYLEDESGRVALEFQGSDCNQHAYCTGLVVGVQGRVAKHGGVLIVDTLHWPRVKAAPAATAAAPTTTTTAPHLLLLSGLDCGSTTEPLSALRRDLLLTFLEGRLPHPAAALVTRVVVCGGLVASTVDALRDLDAFLFQLTAGAGVPVDVLPGANDPTTANWPQRPLHSSLLVQSSQFGLLNRAPNPYASQHKQDGAFACHVLATDGTNVRDLQKHVVLPKRAPQQRVKDDDKENHQDEEPASKFRRLTELEALRKQLDWGHICPTGPTSVPTMPHAFSDPMVLSQWPHVYAAGNCQRFATGQARRENETSFCRLVCVPSFAKTGEAVLLNLQTRQVEVIRFAND